MFCASRQQGEDDRVNILFLAVYNVRHYSSRKTRELHNYVE